LSPRFDLFLMRWDEKQSFEKTLCVYFDKNQINGQLTNLVQKVYSYQKIFTWSQKSAFYVFVIFFWIFPNSLNFEIWTYFTIHYPNLQKQLRN
jgi:hypothetical protein